MSFGIARGRELQYDGWGFEHEDLPPLPAAGETPAFDPRGPWFGRPDDRLEVEIGSGKGTFLVQQSVLEPDTLFLGIEHAGEFFRYAADRARRRELRNVRLLHTDAVAFLRHRLATGIVRVVHLYFSDPWPKSRHHKRRVLQHESLRAFHRVLAPDGAVRVVTDHDELWAWTEQHAEWAAAEGLFARADYHPPASAGAGEMVGTNYERKFMPEGRTIRGLVLRRLGD